MRSQQCSHTPERAHGLCIQKLESTPIPLDVVCEVLRAGRRIVFEGSIQYLSRSGASLVASRLPARDAKLVLTFRRPCGDTLCRRTAKLIHGRPHRQREWLIACEFTEVLSEEDVHDLLIVCQR